MSHSEPTIEQRFLDFRRTGEPAWLAAVFDATSAELLAIARRAVHDPLDAEDVVQATFLTALQKAASFRPGEALMPWLVGILKNHVHKQRSRRAVDVASLLDHEPSAPDGDAAAGELLREVRTAIANLPQPYRTTLSLKLLHGLSASQIAEATGETVGTVRVRVHRGLSMLRGALPRGLAGVLAAVFPALGLSTLRAQVLSSFIPDAAAKVAGATAMKHSLFALAGVLALLLAVVLGFSDGRETGAPAPEALPVVQTTITGDPAPRITAPVPVPERTPVPAADAPAGTEAAPAAIARGAVRISVVDAGAKGVPSVSVRLSDPDGRDALVHGRAGTTSSAGEVLFRDLPSGRYEVRIDRRLLPTETKPADTGNRWTAGTCEVVADTTTEVRFKIADGLLVDGIVVDAAGRPVASADIWCAPFTAPPHPAELVATTDAAGHFHLHATSGEHWICARASGHGPSPTFSPWRATDAAMRTCTLRLELAREGATITGHVVDTAGKPVARASILVGPAMFAAGSSYGEGGIWAKNAAPALLLTDESGAFTLRGAPAGKVPVRAQSPDHPPAEVEVAVAADAVAEVRIVLQPGCSLSGRVLDPKGNGVTSANVCLGSGNAPPVVRTDAEGRYRATGLVAGPLHIVVTADEARRAEASALLEAGAMATCNVTLPEAGLCHGEVRSADGVPLAAWTVIATAEGDTQPRQSRTDLEGKFKIACDAAQLYRLSLRTAVPRGTQPRTIECTWIGQVSGADRNPLTITLPDGLLELGSITGRCLDGSGRPLAGAIRATTAAGDHVAYAALAADGSFRIGPVLPCTLRLAVDPTDQDRPRWSLGEHTLRSGILPLGELRQPPSGFLSLAVVTTGKQAIHAYVRDPSDTIVTMLTCAADGSCRTCLAAGDYTVQAFGLGSFGHGAKPAEGKVRITEGQDQSLRIDLP